MKKLAIAAIASFVIATAPALARDGGDGGGGGRGGDGGGGGHISRDSGGGGGNRDGGGGRVHRPDGGGGRIHHPRVDRAPDVDRPRVDERTNVRPRVDGDRDRDRNRKPESRDGDRDRHDGDRVHRKPESRDGDRDRHDGDRVHRKPDAGERHQWNRHPDWNKHERRNWRGHYFEWWPWWLGYNDPCDYAWRQWKITGNLNWYWRWQECQGY